MRKTIPILILIAIFMSCSCSQEVTPVEVKTYTMEQFLETTLVIGGYFNPDETKLLISSNETGIINAYEIDIASGERTQITDSTTESIFALSYFPEDERILYSSDKGGNEITHLFVRDLEENETDITGEENVRERIFGFADDGKSFFTSATRRNPRALDIYEWSTETLEPELFYENSSGLYVSAISTDKRWIAGWRMSSSNNSDIYLIDRNADGEPVLITEHEGETLFRVCTFSKDGRYLYYLSNQEGEFTYLMRYDLETGGHEEFFKPEWDVVNMKFSPKGTYRMIWVNENASVQTLIARADTGEEVQLPDIPDGRIMGVVFSPSEKLVRLDVASDRFPGNTFVYNFETGELKQVTNTLNPEIDAADLVSCEPANFTARDGLEIPGFIYKPKTAGADNKVPAMLYIHGGPGGQSGPAYNAEVQFLVNHGYAIYFVNNRGSSGYGKSFIAADDRKHGREPLWDCVDAKEHLKTFDWVDPEKIGIMGASYGGYMTLAALAFEPEDFAVGVDIFGVSNWLRTLQSIPPYARVAAKAVFDELGDPETDEEMLRAISPLFHADKITKPLMILQGANDPRVLKAESDDIAAAIEANGGIVEYLLFDDEGHGFTKNENRIKGYTAVLAFLDKYLKGIVEDEEQEGEEGETE